MSQSAARRASGRQAQRNKAPKSNLPLIIGGVVALIVVMVAAGVSLSRNTVSVPVSSSSQTRCLHQPTRTSCRRMRTRLIIQTRPPRAGIRAAILVHGA